MLQKIYIFYFAQCTLPSVEVSYLIYEKAVVITVLSQLFSNFLKNILQGRNNILQGRNLSWGFNHKLPHEN